ncbi:MAG: winged helix-turn-helix domain-containing protein [Bacillota bacterium]
MALVLQIEDEVLHSKIKVNKLYRTVHIGDCTIRLTFKEFDLFYILAKNPYQVFSRQRLLKEIWHEEGDDTEKVAVHMVRLRKKLNPDRRRHQMIRTIWGAGYLFDPGPEGEQ